MYMSESTIVLIMFNTKAFDYEKEYTTTCDNTATLSKRI